MHVSLQDVIQWVGVIVILTILFFVRNRLRINPPKVRVTLGVVGFLLAAVLFYGMLKLLPRPWDPGFSYLTDLATWVVSLAIGALLTLSLIEIFGGSWQAIKRWRHRRSVS